MALTKIKERKRREKRIEKAKVLLESCKDKKYFVKKYKKIMGVGKLCAAKDLHALGLVDDVYLQSAIKHDELLKTKRKEKKERKKQEKEMELIESDDYYAYIAGYTSNGFAYGITWEEWEQMENETYNPISIDKDIEKLSIECDELPF